MIAWWWLIPASCVSFGFGAWLVLWCSERVDVELRALEEHNLERWGHG